MKAIYTDNQWQACVKEYLRMAREECEEKLAELIKVTKAEIAEMKTHATV